MKKYIVLLFVFFQIQVSAQFSWSWVNDSSEHDKSNGIGSTIFQDSILLIGGQTSLSSCYNQGFQALNSRTGEVIYGKDYYGHSFYATSKYFFTATYDRGGDDLGGDERISLVKYNAKGEQLWVLKADHCNRYLNGRMERSYYAKFIDLNNNGQFLIGTETTILIVDTLSKNWSQHLFNKVFVSMKFLNDTTILAATSKNLYKIDTSGIILDSISLNNIAQAKWIDNKIYVLYSNKLVSFDTSFTAQDTLLESSFNLTQLLYENKKIYVLGQQNEEVKLFTLKDEKLIGTRIFPKYINDLTFLISGNSIFFTGTSFSGQMASYHYPLNTKPVEKLLPDIELISTELKGMRISKKFHQINFFCDFTVANRGNDTITSFAAYSFFGDADFCVSIFFYERFDSIILPPNQEITVSGKVSAGDREYEGVHNYCFEVLAPNGGLERIIDNNTRCEDHIIMRVEELQASKTAIYPNPVNNALHFTKPSIGKVVVKIIDMKGVEVLQQQVLNTIVDVSELATGSYIFVIQSDAGSSYTMFLKN